MKSTVLIQDGRMQLVLTPEIDAEKRMIEVFRHDNCGVRIDTANFAECAGRYLRDFKDTQSLIIGIVAFKDADPKQDKPSPSLSNIADGTWPGDVTREPTLDVDDLFALREAWAYFTNYGAPQAPIDAGTRQRIASWLDYHRGRA